MPDGLQAVLSRLTGEQATAYANAAELLEDLDRVTFRGFSATT